MDGGGERREFYGHSFDAGCTPTLCSLRDAVVAADVAGAGSTITLPAGTYKLTIPSTGATDPSTGDLDINNNASVTINGAGSGSTIIDANGIDRAFAVQQGAGLTLSGMTIEHGNPSPNSTGSQTGGAIYSDGALTLNGDVTLSQNAANNGSARGGAIYTDNDQTALSITGATFEDNTAAGGGAISLDTRTDEASVQQSITNSTLTANHAFSGGRSTCVGQPDRGGQHVHRQHRAARQTRSRWPWTYVAETIPCLQGLC